MSYGVIDQRFSTHQFSLFDAGLNTREVDASDWVILPDPELTNRWEKADQQYWPTCSAPKEHSAWLPRFLAMRGFYSRPLGSDTVQVNDLRL